MVSWMTTEPSIVAPTLDEEKILKVKNEAMNKVRAFE